MYKTTTNLFLGCALLWVTACSSPHAAKEELKPTDYVNPFIGASTSVGVRGEKRCVSKFGRSENI